MTVSSNPNQKPGLVTAIAAMTLTSGIVNLFWGIVASITFLSTFVGVVCLPIMILPTILGIFEIIYAARLLSTQPQSVRPLQTIAILEILCILYFNIFSMVVGILALVFYNDLVVKDYFARLNETIPPASPPPIPLPDAPAPVEPEDLPPAPDLPEPPLPPDNRPPAPEPKKPRIRKVAGK